MAIEALADLWPAIEQSAFGQASKSWRWLYPAANIAHVVGASLLLGAIVVYDILIVSRRSELARSIDDVALPVAMVGVLLALSSAPILFAADAAALAGNPAFIVKLALVLGAFLNVALLYAGRGGRSESRRIAHAWFSACFWIWVVIAGRAIAYV